MDKEVTPLKLSLEQPPRTELEINLSIIRGFISLYFDGDPANIIHRPLDRLNGKTLYFMAGRHFDVVRAWMKEISRHPEERNRYVESKLLSK